MLGIRSGVPVELSSGPSYLLMLERGELMLVRGLRLVSNKEKELLPMMNHIEN